MSNQVVVYYFADPGFKGDISSAMKELQHLGFRVVKGDNADELLFLLQVGRPAAVIYTLKDRHSKGSASYQMVSRRALDLLVPIILVGPDDPRDGVVGVYPSDRSVVEKSHPYRMMAKIIAGLDANPPATESKPPKSVRDRTLGRGRTLLNWKAAESFLEQEEEGRSTLVSPEKPVVDPMDPMHPESHERADTVRGLSSVQTEKEESPIPAPLPRGVSNLFEDTMPVSNMRKAPKVPEVEEESDGKGIRIVAVALSAVALIAIAVVIVLALTGGRDIPESMPRIGSAPAQAPSAQTPSAQALPAQPPVPTPVPQLPQPAPVEQSPPAAVLPAPLGVEQPVAVATPDPAQKPTASIERPSEQVRFPGHFRDGSALFWFSDQGAEAKFLGRARALAASGGVIVVGRATTEEIGAGATGLGLSRAWAVEKYLIRQGFHPDTITTVKGDVVHAYTDHDPTGWPRNRWVEIRGRLSP